MKYAYPAIFYPDDGKIGVTVPDLPGCHTFGEDAADALFMAQDAIEMWLWDAEENNEVIPKASTQADIAKQTNDELVFVSMVAADTDEYRRQNDARAVKKTLSIPAWLNTQATAANINFSQTLQKALKQELQIAE